MIQEISCLGFNDEDCKSFFSSTPLAKENLQMHIYRETNIPTGIKKYPMTHRTKLNATEKKTLGAANLAPMDVNTKGGFDIRCDWGGSEGPKISGSISGSISDNKGNDATIKFEADNDGNKSISVSGNHDPKNQR
jgi:hypothetical protein